MEGCGGGAGAGPARGGGRAGAVVPGRCGSGRFCCSEMMGAWAAAARILGCGRLGPSCAARAWWLCPDVLDLAARAVPFRFGHATTDVGDAAGCGSGVPIR
ncbi:hypothetical protein VPH35_016697 [Triticum aestivum]